MLAYSDLYEYLFLGQPWDTTVCSLWPRAQAVSLTNQLAHSFPDLLHPFTVLQSLGRATPWPGLSLALWAQMLQARQTLRLNEAAVWKEPTLLFPQNQASEVAAGNTIHRWEG